MEVWGGGEGGFESEWNADEKVPTVQNYVKSADCVKLVGFAKRFYKSQRDNKT